MSQSFYRNTKQNDNSDICSKGCNIYPINKKSGFPENRVIIPPSNSLAGTYRCKPQTSIASSQLLASNAQIDYLISGTSFINSLLWDIIVQNTGSTALNIAPVWCIDRVEFYGSDSQIVQTVYNTQIFLQLTLENYDYFERVSVAEGYNPTNFGGVSIAAGASQEFFLHIPCFIDSCSGWKANSLNAPMRMRIYFSAYGCDTPQNLQFTQADIISRGPLFDSYVEQAQNQMRSNELLKWTVPMGIRGSLQAISNFSPNSQYDILLSSLSGYYSQIFVLIRTAPDSYANRTVFTPVLSLQLLDQNAVLVGVEMTDLYLRSHNSLNYPGWVMNSQTGLQGLYAIPFFQGSASEITNGNQTGLYLFSGLETLRIRTNSTMTAGSYNITVFGIQYQNIIVNKGNLTVQNN